MESYFYQTSQNVNIPFVPYVTDRITGQSEALAVEFADKVTFLVAAAGATGATVVQEQKEDFNSYGHTYSVDGTKVTLHLRGLQMGQTTVRVMMKLGTNDAQIYFVQVNTTAEVDTAETTIEVLINIVDTVYLGGGGGFEPTEEQFSAMNSGITTEKVVAFDTTSDTVGRDETVDVEDKTTVVSALNYTYDELKKIKGKVLNFVGFVSQTAPTGTIANGSLWFDGTALPTTFPMAVKKYDNGAWSSTTENYTANNLDLWSNLENGKGYYWFGNGWNLIDEAVLVDDIIIAKNQEGELTLKEKTATDKFKSWVLKDDGTWNLEKITRWQVVQSPLDRPTLDDRTLIVVGANSVVISSTIYRKGVYFYDGTQLVKVATVLLDSDETSDLSDTDTFSSVDSAANTNKRWTLLKVWDYIKGKITSVYYPVGSVIFNMGTNPSDNFGGTWELLTTGTKALYLDATAGTTIEEELPNITGKIDNLALKGDRRNVSKTGALSKSTSYTSNWGGTNSGDMTGLNKIEFDASLSSSVYKDNGHVRPAGITICAWKRTV